MTEQTVYLVNKTESGLVERKKIIYTANGELLNMPFEVEHEYTRNSCELVTELGDLSPVEEDSIEEGEFVTRRQKKRISYEATKYEYVEPPIRPSIFAHIHQWRCVTDPSEEDEFDEWLKGQCGKQIFLGTEGRGKYFAKPTRDGNIITVNTTFLYEW